jgi:hypothetical protein
MIPHAAKKHKPVAIALPKSAAFLAGALSMDWRIATPDTCLSAARSKWVFIISFSLSCRPCFSN